MLIIPKLYHDIKYYQTCILSHWACIVRLYIDHILGQSILSDQFSIPSVEVEVNIGQIPARSRDVVVEYFMSNNFTLMDNLTNVSTSSLCSSAAAEVRDVLTTFTSLEISCAPECGEKSTN